MQLLADTIAHTHGHASMYLHLCKLRIQKFAAVMHIDDMEDFDLSKLHIYFDFCKTAAGRDRYFFSPVSETSAVSTEELVRL